MKSLEKLDPLKFAASRLHRAIEDREAILKTRDEYVHRTSIAFEETLAKYRLNIKEGRFLSGDTLIDNIILHGDFEAFEALEGLTALNERFKKHQGEYVQIIITDRQPVFFIKSRKIQHIEIQVSAIVGKILGEIEIKPDMFAQSLAMEGIREFKIDLPTSSYYWDKIAYRVQEGRVGMGIYTLDEPVNTDLTGLILGYAGVKNSSGNQKIQSIQMSDDRDSLVTDGMTVYAQLKEESCGGHPILWRNNEKVFREFLEGSLALV